MNLVLKSHENVLIFSFFALKNSSCSSVYYFLNEKLAKSGFEFASHSELNLEISRLQKKHRHFYDETWCSAHARVILVSSLILQCRMKNEISRTSSPFGLFPALTTVCFKQSCIIYCKRCYTMMWSEGKLLQLTRLWSNTCWWGSCALACS